MSSRSCPSPAYSLRGAAAGSIHAKLAFDARDSNDRDDHRRLARTAHKPSRPTPRVSVGGWSSSPNTDSIVHRVVLNDSTVDTGEIAPVRHQPRGGDAGRRHQLPLPAFRPGMIGAVSGSSGGTPPCTGPYCDPGP